MATLPSILFFFSSPVFLLRKSHGQRRLVGYSLWGRKESDMAEWAHMHTNLLNDSFLGRTLRQFLLMTYSAKVLPDSPLFAYSCSSWQAPETTKWTMFLFRCFKLSFTVHWWLALSLILVRGFNYPEVSYKLISDDSKSEWITISHCEFLLHNPVHTCMLSCFSCVQLFATPWTVACQAPLSMEFLRQEYWSGLPCPSPGDLPNPGTEPIYYGSCIGDGFFTQWATWKASYSCILF